MERVNRNTDNNDINTAGSGEDKEKTALEHGGADAAKTENSEDAAKNEEAEETDAASTAETGNEEQSDAGEKEKKEEAAKRGGKKKKQGFKKYIHSTKFRRTSISTAFTVGFIAVVVLINVIVGILGNKFPSMNVDMTKSGLNSLSTQSGKVVDSVKIPVSIYVLTSRQQAESDSSYHQISSLTAKMVERNPKISVKYVDLDKDPTFSSNYKNEKLQSGDVLVQSDKRYRLLTSSDLFTQQASQDYTSAETYSNVDSALASALNTVISDKLPLAAFDTAHSEDLDATAYKTLLANNSFKTDDFSLLTDSIPKDTQIVVLGCPTTDLTDSEVDKLDKFLSDKSLAADRSLLVTYSPGQKEMPKLSTFLKEWGISVQQSGVILESNAQKYWYNQAQSYPQVNIIADIQSSPDLGSGASDYGTYFTAPLSDAVNILFEAKGSKTTYPLIKSSDSSYLVTDETKSTNNIKKSSYNIAALSQDTVTAGSKSYKSNVIVCGSSQMFADGIVNANSFANGKYVTALSKYAAGTQNSANSVDIQSKNANVKDITLSANMINFFGVWIFMFLIPFAVIVTGIVVYVRRKRL